MVRIHARTWALVLLSGVALLAESRAQAQHMHGGVSMGAPTAAPGGISEGCPDGSCNNGCSQGGIGCPVPFINIRPRAYSSYCPPPLCHCQEGPPKLKVRVGCPKPICDPCKYEHYGYFEPCWRRWPFPPDWSHCPCPPPSAELDFPAPPLAGGIPVPTSSPEVLPEPQMAPANSQNSFYRVPVGRVPNNFNRVSY